MADIMKQFIRHMDGIHKAAMADAAGKAIAEHCDKRIEKLRKAVKREEKYLFKVLRAKNTGGVMAGDIEGVFHRLMTTLDQTAVPRKSLSAGKGEALPLCPCGTIRIGGSVWCARLDCPNTPHAQDKRQ